MKACEWQERVAMLLDEEEPAARQHVAACSACAELLADLGSDRDLLRSAPVPVMRLRRIRRYPPVWAWAAAAAVVLGLWLWPRPTAVEPLEIAVRAPAAPEVMRSQQRPAVVRPSRPRPSPPRLAEALEAVLPPVVNSPVTAKGEVVVAMQTEDPNVIIVLVQGDSDE